MPGKGRQSKKPGLHLGGWVPPGKDSGPGDRQPLGQASHQKKQEKHQGGATGLWGTVGWARGGEGPDRTEPGPRPPAPKPR